MDPLRDTDAATQRVLTRLLRSKSVGERLAMIDEAFETGRMLAMAGLRSSHPGAGEATIEREYFHQVLGEELGDKVLAARGVRDEVRARGQQG
jgi:hypothetical protein